MSRGSCCAATAARAAVALSVGVLIFTGAADAQVVNGDFEAGNVGFTSGYAYSPGGNNTEGQYTVGTNGQAWNVNFTPMPDHTTGSGNMLIVNGATSGNPVVWEQTVPVLPSTAYDFSAWVATAVSGGPADLVVLINGTQLGSSFTAPPDPGTWSNFARPWTSGPADTTATVQIFNTDQSTFPNDFYIDDISLTVPEPSSVGVIAVGGLMLIRRRR